MTMPTKPRRLLRPVSRTPRGKFATDYMATVLRGKGERFQITGGAMPSQVRPVMKPLRGRERLGVFTAPPRPRGAERPPRGPSPIASFGGAVRKEGAMPSGHVVGANPIGGIGVTGEVDSTRGAYPHRPRASESYGQPLIPQSPAEQIGQRFMWMWDEKHVTIRGHAGTRKN